MDFKIGYRFRKVRGSRVVDRYTSIHDGWERNRYGLTPVLAVKLLVFVTNFSGNKTELIAMKPLQ